MRGVSLEDQGTEGPEDCADPVVHTKVNRDEFERKKFGGCGESDPV